jgi:hypothetical protein
LNENRRFNGTLIGAILLTTLILIVLFLAIKSGLDWYLDPQNKLTIDQEQLFPSFGRDRRPVAFEAIGRSRFPLVNGVPAVCQRGSRLPWKLMKATI